MIELIVVFVCLLLNAILSCLEMAFVTVSRPHIKQLAQKGSTSAKLVLALKGNPERVLSVIQIGITLVGIISAAVGGAGASDYLEPLLVDRWGLSEDTAEALSIAIIAIPLTYFSVIIGELVPKTLALRFPVKFALLGARILLALDKVFSPFIFILEVPTKFMARFIFSRFKSESPTIAAADVDLDQLTETHKQYVFNLLDIDKRVLSDLMVPWEEVTTIDISEHYFSVLEVIRKSRHTRIPVLQEGSVMGLLHAQEFTAEPEITKLDWTELIRPILKLRATDRIINTLKQLQNNASHLAIIEKGNLPVGIVTLEDIFEEIVGDIYDEDDNPRALLSANSKIRTMNIIRKSQ
jgi:putative hemolysin